MKFNVHFKIIERNTVFSQFPGTIPVLESLLDQLPGVSCKLGKNPAILITDDLALACVPAEPADIVILMRDELNPDHLTVPQGIVVCNEHSFHNKLRHALDGLVQKSTIRTDTSP